MAEDRQREERVGTVDDLLDEIESESHQALGDSETGRTLKIVLLKMQGIPLRRLPRLCIYRQGYLRKG